MKRFVRLFEALDGTTATKEKIALLRAYFEEAEPEDAAWAVWLLSGNKPKGSANRTRLAAWASEEAGIAGWLFDECRSAVGDFAETIALLLPKACGSETGFTLAENAAKIESLAVLDETGQREVVLSAWRGMDGAERLVFNKLVTGAFRVGVSRDLVVRGLSEALGVPRDEIAHRLMGDWRPTAEFYSSLTDGAPSPLDRPYPFCLAHPIAGDPAELGAIEGWQAEWKWDGIRAQVIRRNGTTAIWSRGEELVTDRYPEIEQASRLLPEGCVLDGELLPWGEGGPMPFNQLQRRIGRKTVGAKLLTDIPVVLMAYDLLESDGQDRRPLPLSERRDRLATVVNEAGHPFLLSPTVEAGSWEELGALQRSALGRGAEGLMLKRLDSPYGVGRRKGAWWKWKLQPRSVDAVLMYALRGSGSRASLFTDYAFGVWKGHELVTIAKAYSGLTNAEIREVDAYIRANTLEKIGPARTVPPELVFEIGFEGIQKSTRHKSGYAVRFPRILRWRRDKRPEDADTLETVASLFEPLE